MQKEKTPMPEQAADVRNKNFTEVALGYTESDALNEAARCLDCKNPACVSGCPVSVDIPAFIREMKNGDFFSAYNVIKNTSSLPAVCGRVCPQESQCEGKCVRCIKGESVSIGRLERFCADYAMKNGVKEEKITLSEDAPKVAIIGSGPAGLTCAGDLAKRGYKVTVFEALHKAGGVLIYGIPEFRLPKDIVAKEIENLKEMGVEIVCDMVIGRVLSIDELLEDGYKAVFVATGAGLPRFMGIPGENSNGVYSANEFLTRINLMKAGREKFATPIKKSSSVAIVGGGNVAMDAARCAKRLGADNVYIVYRRGEEEMPARREEIHHAKEEGIEFHLLTNPIEVIADEKGNATALKCIRRELGEPDASGRRSPKEIEGSEFTLDVGTVVIAVGTSPNPLIRMTTPGLDTDRRGCIVTSDGVTTTKDGVFAGGDAVTGAATVILAMGAGREAAQKIDDYVKSSI